MVVKHTPLEQQVLTLKKEYPNVLLLIEIGNKYCFFGKDAQVSGISQKCSKSF
jgi:DNA mismatch repair protein MSH3